MRSFLRNLALYVLLLYLGLLLIGFLAPSNGTMLGIVVLTYLVAHGGVRPRWQNSWALGVVFAFTQTIPGD